MSVTRVFLQMCAFSLVQTQLQPPISRTHTKKLTRKRKRRQRHQRAAPPRIPHHLTIDPAQHRHQAPVVRAHVVNRARERRKPSRRRGAARPGSTLPVKQQHEAADAIPALVRPHPRSHYPGRPGRHRERLGGTPGARHAQVADAVAARWTEVPAVVTREGEGDHVTARVDRAGDAGDGARAVWFWFMDVESLGLGQPRKPIGSRFIAAARSAHTTSPPSRVIQQQLTSTPLRLVGHSSLLWLLWHMLRTALIRS